MINWNSFRRHKITALAMLGAGIMAVSSEAFAAAVYEPGAVHVGGDQVCFQGDLYQAKWWAGPEQSPADVHTVAKPWETPWELLAADVSECDGGNSGNTAPTVVVTAVAASVEPDDAMPVSLFADAQDVDGDLLTYEWQQVVNEAPSVAIEDATSSVASVILPEVTQDITYVFRVTVSDGTTMTSDEVSLHVAPAPGNHAPVAVAAASVDQIVGAGMVTLSAFESTDVDGGPLHYQWQQVAPVSPVALIDDPTAIEPMVTLDEPADDTSFVFAVQVSDGVLTSQAQVVVTQLVDVPSAQCPIWAAGAVYVADDVVVHGGQNWAAHWWTQGEEPGTTGEWGVWRASALADCSGSTGPGPDPDPNPNPGPGPGPDPDPNPTVVKLSDLLADEADLTAGEGMDRVRDSIATLDNDSVEMVAPLDPANPHNVLRVESIVSAADWEYLFPRRAPEYTYVNFLKAIAKFPAFCGDYADGRDADAICRRALATMFAHFTQETGGHTIAWPEPQWRQGLVYLRELGWSEDAANGYGLCDPGIWQGQQWPCSEFPAGHPAAGQFKSYFGRGAKQLSYNYNYGPFSHAMYGDESVLLEQPNLVADTWLNLASAVFFYVYPQPPKPSMLHALDGTWAPNVHDIAGGLTPGFGVTTQIINGGIECGGSAEHQQSLNRIEYYVEFAAELDVPVPAEEVLGCANMQRFDTQGAGALDIYWEQDWSQDNACKLVNYQTRFSAFTTGDYVRCVVHFFDVDIDLDN